MWIDKCYEEDEGEIRQIFIYYSYKQIFQYKNKFKPLFSTILSFVCNLQHTKKIYWSNIFYTYLLLICVHIYLDRILW